MAVFEIPFRARAHDHSAELSASALSRHLPTSGAVAYFEAFGADQQLNFGRLFERDRHWIRGLEPGGALTREIKAPLIPFNQLSQAERLYLTFAGQGMLDNLRYQPVGEILRLHAIGERMISEGTNPLDLGQLTGVEPSINLRSGERIVLSTSGLSTALEDHQLLFTAIREWSWTLPNGNLHYKETKREPKIGPTSTQHPDSRISARTLAEMLSVATILARDPELLQSVLDANIGTDLRSFNSVFSAKFQSDFAVFQWAKAWWPRKLAQEPHSCYESVDEYYEVGKLKHSDQIVLQIIGKGILNYLRTEGRAVIEHMVDVGERIIASGYNLEGGTFTNPKEGMPLMNGDKVIMHPGLLDRLATLNHFNWYIAHLFNQSMPDRSLWRYQPGERKEMVVWDSSTPDQDLNPDRVNAYFLCYALANLKHLRPQDFSLLLNNSLAD